MLSDNEREIVNQMIKVIISHGFENVIAEEIYLSDWYEKAIESDDFTCVISQMRSGASKAVFFGEGLEHWVLKVAKPGYIYLTAKEAEVYKMAKEKNLSHLLAPCFLFDTVNDLSFYIQAKCSVNENVNSEIFYNSIAERYDKEDFEDENCYQDAVEEAVCDMEDCDRLEAIFGYDDGIRAAKFLCFELGLNDFHEGNFGFLPSGDIVLIDYSGF